MGTYTQKELINHFGTKLAELFLNEFKREQIYGDTVCIVFDTETLAFSMIRPGSTVNAETTVFLCNVPAEMLVAMAVAHEPDRVRGYKQKAKDCRDWYTSDTYHIAKELRDEVRGGIEDAFAEGRLIEAIAEEVSSNQASDQASTWLPLTEDLSAKIFAAVSKRCSEDSDLSYDWVGNKSVQRSVMGIINALSYRKATPKADSPIEMRMQGLVFDMVLFAQDTFAGSRGDYFVTAFERGLRDCGLAIGLSGEGKNLSKLVKTVKANIKESAVYPENMLANVKEVLAYYGVKG